MFDRCYPPLNWEAFKSNWPMSDMSRWVQTPHLRWHVQILGQGPVVVLIHGTGATTHTWWQVAPLLAKDHTVLCLDLPGHGFSSEFKALSPTPHQVAQDMAVLLKTLGLEPQVMIGHSAGALVAAQWWLTQGQAASPCALVAINPAWQSLPGPAQWLFPVGAWLIDLNPLSGWLLAQKALRPGMVERVLEQTGSRLQETSIKGYRQMWQQARHVRGVLRLMRAWDLRAVEHRLSQLQTPVQVHVGMNDATVPPSLADAAMALLPQAELKRWPGLGHLLHEECPEEWVNSVREWLSRLRQTAH